MAEALLRNGLGPDSEITVSSAGIGALVGFPAAEHAVDLMRAWDPLLAKVAGRWVRPVAPGTRGACEDPLAVQRPREILDCRGCGVPSAAPSAHIRSNYRP